jgi:diaminohydroxyphosphoribosylaminopyrimidine deaminase / 5-amino-6-(5-phosphoribosylamino)uracil reductase
MQQALELAKQGLGRVEPNPLVGCVLVRDGELISSGYHRQYGGPHAERDAVEVAKNNHKSSMLGGSTAYVTLEPCCHHGKTPPCTDILVEVGVKRVVAAMRDPFAAVNGGGIQQLRDAGITVEVGCEQAAAQALNAAYIKRLSAGRPWVIAKWAMSLDGRIATSNGHSQWISCETSRETTHKLRSRVDAIIVGRGTASADDPMLNARLSDGTQPLRTALRVVVDSQLTLSPKSKLAQTAKEYPTLVWSSAAANLTNLQALQKLGVRVELCDEQDRSQRLDKLLQFLVSEYTATNVLVEGGGQLLGGLFDRKQIDQCEIFIAPRLIGGSGAISPIGGQGVSKVTDGPTCYDVTWNSSGIDQHLSCRLSWK